MIKRFFILGFILLVMVGDADAFNGNRKGFTMSIGGGLIPHRSNYSSRYQDNTSFIVDWYIGHGFSEKDLLLYGINIDFVKFHDLNTKYHMSQNRSVCWHHYFKKSKENSFMSKLGFSYIHDIKYLIGAGYQFKGNYQLDLYYWTDFLESSTKQIRLTFSYAAY